MTWRTLKKLLSRHWPEYSMIGGGLALLGLLWAGVSSVPELSSGPAWQVAAPAFELPNAQGKRVKLSDFKGQGVILHFWASWCAPCLRELPDLLQAAQTLQKTVPNLVILAVSLDRDFSEAQRVLPKTPLPANVVSVLDREQKVPDLYGSYQYPESYLIGTDGRIRTKLVGPQAWNGEELQQVLRQLASGS